MKIQRRWRAAAFNTI